MVQRVWHRDVRCRSSWLIGEKEIRVSKIIKEEILRLGGSVTITQLYKLSYGKQYTRLEYKILLVKFVIMRWLWLGLVRTTCNNGIKVIRWVGKPKVRGVKNLV